MTERQKPNVTMYTDGGCQPNPGAGGYGVVLLHGDKRLELSGGFRSTTNNRMEILAVIKGLEFLTEPSKVTIFSDSQYVVNAIMQNWAVRWRAKGWWRTRTEQAVNVDLWERLLALCQFHSVEFRWVKGHAGTAENERCDQLSVAALRCVNLECDPGFENKILPRAEVHEQLALTIPLI